MGRLPSGLLLSFRPFRPFSEALRAFPIVLRRICRYMMRIPDRFRLFLSISLVFISLIFSLGGLYSTDIFCLEDTADMMILMIK